MDKKTVMVAGASGMVGSSFVRRLSPMPNVSLLMPTRKEVDLTRQSEVEDFFSNNDVDEIILAAARVGGIVSNWNQPADYIYENLMIQTNVIEAAKRAGIKKLLFIGSSCIYPKLAEQPIREESFLSGHLEITNMAYAVAKISGMIMTSCYQKQYSSTEGLDFRSVMPTNLYGPNDNYDEFSGHVIPSLIRRAHFAKLNKDDHLLVFGSGSPKREFLHVDDMTRACLQVMELTRDEYDNIASEETNFLNIGGGHEVSIKDLASQIVSVVGFEGDIVFDTNQPDGTPRKLLDNRRMEKLGWKAQMNFHDGLKGSYEDFVRRFG